MLNFKKKLESPRFTRTSQKISGGGGPRDLGQGEVNFFVGGGGGRPPPPPPCTTPVAMYGLGGTFWGRAPQWPP
jgi:hypothetical protein